jgi:hypothetical protein
MLALVSKTPTTTCADTPTACRGHWPRAGKLVLVLALLLSLLAGVCGGPPWLAAAATSEAEEDDRDEIVVVLGVAATAPSAPRRAQPSSPDLSAAVTRHRHPAGGRPFSHGRIPWEHQSRNGSGTPLRC